MATTVYSYVVRYDSGFAPNPFYGFCTLATCKPLIRRTAQIGALVIGTGSASRGRSTRLVYAMSVTETVEFADYWRDPRFLRKRPNLRGSSKHAAGDNIYFSGRARGEWRQLDSYHSRANGQPNQDHIQRDTSVNRVLISDQFVYYGGSGPEIPRALRDPARTNICKAGMGHKKLEDPAVIHRVLEWLESLNEAGCVGTPLDWLEARI